jgi:hypothetical protein
MRVNALVLSAVLSCLSNGATVAVAQSATERADQAELKVTKEERVPLQGALYGKARCDSSGNIYFMVLDNESAKQRFGSRTLPIQKIDSHGVLGPTFRISDGPPGLLNSGFFATGDGRVYVATRRYSDRRVYVLQFSRTGELISTIPMELPPSIPRQIVVFQSGELLLSGTNGNLSHTPFTAVFDPTGKLLRRVYEPEDEHARQRAELFDESFVAKGMTEDNLTVAKGDITLGSDGNAYLLRATSPGLIYVISPKGEVVRKLQIAAPSSGMVGREIRAGINSLALTFRQEGSTRGVVKILSYDGNEITEYAPGDDSVLPGLPGCYDSKSFTFLRTNSEHEIFLHKVEPR